jgi:hypothetical protein
MQAFIHTKCARPDGTYDTYQTISVPVKETETPWKGRTASGYGSALPTPYMVRYNGRWQRVKVICYSNAGSAYIGKKFTPCLTVDIDRD